jgi:hypothetical protein
MNLFDLKTMEVVTVVVVVGEMWHLCVMKIALTIATVRKYK